MRALVIGTTGQLATELHRQHSDPNILLAIPRRVDVTDAAAINELLNEHEPALIINASGYTAVDRAEHERTRAFAVNAEGPRYLARWCSKHAAVLVHLSTDYVFDGAKQFAYTETDAVRPLNVYGASKLAGEQAIREELERHLIVRTSWVFSAHGQNFVKTIRRLARERSELRVVADQHGRPTSAADLAAAVWRVARERLVGNGELPWGTYHLANSEVTTWHGLAQAVVELDASDTGRRPDVVPITTSDYPTPANRPTNSVLDTSLFEASFGFALRSFRPALLEVVTELNAG